jgi:HEAT repeat protein
LTDHHEELAVSSAFGYLGRSSDEWVVLLDHEDPIERRLAAHALGEATGGGSAEVEALRRHLSDPVSFVRTWVAASLARLDPGAEDALGVLAETARDEHDFVRSLAAWSLGRVAGPEQLDRARAVLEPLLDDPAPSVRSETRRALDRLARLERGVSTS